MTNGMSLARLCEHAGLGRPPAIGGGDVRVTGVAYDSRRVLAGHVFVGIPGHQLDGASFATDALARGAVAVVAEGPAPPGLAGPWIRVDEARVALARLAAAWQGDPSQELLVVGITGTNGKTTTTYLLEAVFREAGISCGRLSSVTYRVGARERPAERTTPEAPELQAMLREMVAAGHQACVMEVSSHALDLHRVDAITFGAAVFTNLTRDHLDYHRDMNRYFAAKRRLFDLLADGAPAVVNVDDDYGRRLVPDVSRPVTFALERPADVKPARLALGLEGIEIDAETPRGLLQVRSTLLGRNNASNLLAAVAVGIALALPFSEIERGLRAVERVPGRMEVVSGSEDDVAVLVDFAHTDDALKGLLETARPLARRRVITVFGCGGDRDRTKRPLMGTVAARLSDLVVLTSDNPRSEDPVAIAQDIEAGLASSETPWLRVLDREEAIHRAVTEAESGDLVVVAGKGHERYQIIGARSLPFEDQAVARDALARRRAGSRVG